MPNRRRLIHLLAVAFLLAGTLWFTQGGANPRAMALRQPLDQLTLALGKWRGAGPDQAMDEPSLELLKPQDYLLRTYRDSALHPCAVFVAFFGMQREGAMIHSPRHCLPGGGWQILERQPVAINGPGGPWVVNHLVIGHGLTRLSVLYWYQGRGRVQADEYRDRLLLAWDGLRLGRSDGALVRLTAPAPGDMQPVLEGQMDLAQALIPALDAMLPPSPLQARP